MAIAITTNTGSSTMSPAAAVVTLIARASQRAVLLFRNPWEWISAPGVSASIGTAPVRRS